MYVSVCKVCICCTIYTIHAQWRSTVTNAGPYISKHKSRNDSFFSLFKSSHICRELFHLHIHTAFGVFNYIWLTVIITLLVIFNTHRFQCWFSLYPYIWILQRKCTRRYLQTHNEKIFAAKLPTTINYLLIIK